jgi:diguanylate cyclase (GGDEF)-like protein
MFATVWRLSATVRKHNMNAIEFLERVDAYILELEGLEKAGTFQSEQQRWGLLNTLPEQVRPQVASQLRVDRRVAEHKVGAAETERRVAARRAAENEQQIFMDPGTRLFNKKAYARHQEQKKGWTHLVIDLSHFKSVNDTLGHESGEAALQGIAGLLHSAGSTAKLNKRDFLVHRYGGDEFVVMFKTPLHAALFARAFRDGLDKLRWGRAKPQPGQEGDADGSSIQASATMGIGRNFHEADVAAAIAKSRKNQRVSEHLTSIHPDFQNNARADLLRTGQIGGKSLVEIHSLLPGFDGPMEAGDLDPRWSAAHARKPLSSASTNDAALNPVSMPAIPESNMRQPVPQAPKVKMFKPGS